jgi:AcrR family transcriptional regulator
VTSTDHRRRIPRQERSRQRVEAILDAARELVVEGGSDAMRMSDIAQRAGVPIGSVYQYFPDKPAILRELALRVMTRVRGQVVELMSGVRDADDALARIDLLLTGYYALFLAEPDARDILAATQSDKDLQELDLQDSRANAAIISAALRPLAPPEHGQRIDDASLVLTHLSGAAGRLAMAAGPETGERLMAEFRLAVHHHVADLLGER